MPARSQLDSGDESPPSSAASPSQAAPPSAQRDLAVRSRSESRRVSGSKRKRSETANGENSSHRRRTVEPSPADSEDEEEERGERAGDDDDVYDPDQPVDERRKVVKGFRDLMRNVNENPEELLDKNSHTLHETILAANQLSKKLRQTAEATIDSRLLVTTTDLSYRKTLRLTQGSLAHGLDIDEFVSKCITYMRHGGGIEDDSAPELSSTQRQRRRVSRSRTVGNNDDDDDEVGDEGDMMNWSHLGRFACLPHIRRPALPALLFGPLSKEKKVRKITKRSAPFRPNSLTETRPEVLNVEDLAKRENDLTAICGKILQQLERVQAETQEKVVALLDDDMSEEESNRIMLEHGLRSTGGIDLMRFVVNPRSFGQTVENIFYVSFLIRDGRVVIDFDDNDMPSLAPVDREEDGNGDPASHRSSSKHQAILSMDMATWQDIVNTLELKDSMIEHRKEASGSGPGARGWYS